MTGYTSTAILFTLIVLVGLSTCDENSCQAPFVWRDCGTACPRTCERKNPVCIAVCVSECQCPTDLIFHNGTCIDESLCPEVCAPEEIDKCGQYCANMGRKAQPGTECAGCTCISACTGVRCDVAGEVCQTVDVNCFKAPCPPVPECTACTKENFMDCGLKCADQGLVPDPDRQCLGLQCPCKDVCQGHKCGEGEECFPQEVQCVTVPCYPQPACIKKTAQEKCSKGTPLMQNGAEVFCGRGPNRQSCPDNYECVIEPTDRWAVCCEVHKKCPAGEPYKTAAGMEMSCDSSTKCPSGYVCTGDLTRSAGVCCEDTSHDDKNLCLGDLRYQECGLSCKLTCENYQLVDCDASCKTGCLCPSESPISYRGRCISGNQCPTCDDDTVNTCRKKCGMQGLVAKIGTECTTCECQDACVDYRCPSNYKCMVKKSKTCPDCEPKPSCVGLPTCPVNGMPLVQNGMPISCKEMSCPGGYVCNSGLAGSICCPQVSRDSLPARAAKNYISLLTVLMVFFSLL